MFSVPRLAKLCEIILVFFVVGCLEMCPFNKKRDKWSVRGKKRRILTAIER